MKLRTLTHSIIITYSIIHSSPMRGVVGNNSLGTEVSEGTCISIKSRNPGKVILAQVHREKSMVTCHIKYLMKTALRKKSISIETVFFILIDSITSGTKKRFTAISKMNKQFIVCNSFRL